MVLRPVWSGVQTARAVSPLGIGAKKLVLLSMVAVTWPLASAALAVMPPMVSAQPITAPPCMTPRRLQSSSRITSSASLRSGDRLINVKPMSLPNPIGSQSAIAVLALISPSTLPDRIGSVGCPGGGAVSRPGLEAGKNTRCEPGCCLRTWQAIQYFGNSGDGEGPSFARRVENIRRLKEAAGRSGDGSGT